MKENKKYLLRLGNGGRYLKSYTLTEKGDVDEVTTTVNKENAMHFELNDAAEYKTGLFRLFKPEIIEKDAMVLYIPSHEDYNIMMERRLQKASNKQLADEICSRFHSSFTVAEVRERLRFCFGRGGVHIHYTDNEKEVNIEEVFKGLKNGSKSFINKKKLTQYRWQCNENVEVIELARRNNYMWIHKRYVIDFKYKSPLEMLTDKKFKFPTTGYKEGFVCEEVFYGNTHDKMEEKDGKTIISPFKWSRFNVEI